MNYQTPFFVTGLPRSRSAWLANWLTTDRTLCLHDVPFSMRLLRLNRRVGFAGPELIEEYAQIRTAVPEAPWLVVWREPREALDSFRRWAGSFLPRDANALNRIWEARVNALLDLGHQSRLHQAAFNALDREPIARSIWAHLLPDVAFDVERWELLRGLNVQQDLNRPAARARLPRRE